jgi:hypothetical protein
VDQQSYCDPDFGCANANTNANTNTNTERNAFSHTNTYSDTHTERNAFSHTNAGTSCCLKVPSISNGAKVISGQKDN